MSVPALAQMGALTGDRTWFDDAVKQVLQFHGHLWDPQAALYAHGKHMNQPLNPEFYWARANGWAMLASVELLDVLPADHPGRGRVLEALRAHIRSIAKLQSGTSGLWHQMLDKPDSYLETSASAIFVYSIARAINRGWISPVSYGSVAQAGWIGVDDASEPEGPGRGHLRRARRSRATTSTTTTGPRRCTRPTATDRCCWPGAEMIRLLQNPAHRRPVQAAHLPLRPEAVRARAARRQRRQRGGLGPPSSPVSRFTCSQRACSRCSVISRRARSALRARIAS